MMGADNWDVCPRCLRKATKERSEKVRAVTDAYGKVPAEEYERMRAEVAAIEVFGEEEGEQTLREDYELGLLDGAFFVDYRGKCTACDFSHTFKHSEQLVP